MVSSFFFLFSFPLSLLFLSFLLLFFLSLFSVQLSVCLVTVVLGYRIVQEVQLQTAVDADLECAGG